MYYMRREAGFHLIEGTILSRVTLKIRDEYMEIYSKSWAKYDTNNKF